jgi:hypothetical protein
MSVLPQITYGNTAFIFLSHFHGHNKNEIFVDYWASSAPIITSRAIRCEMATRGTWISWIANEWKL